MQTHQILVLVVMQPIIIKLRQTIQPLIFQQAVPTVIAKQFGSQPIGITMLLIFRFIVENTKKRGRTVTNAIQIQVIMENLIV